VGRSVQHIGPIDGTRAAFRASAICVAVLLSIPAASAGQDKRPTSRPQDASILGSVPRFVGVNYECLYHRYTTPDPILQRDFARFRRDGLNVISLHLYWQRLEGNTRGDYGGQRRLKRWRGEIYGDPFLDQVKRVIRAAHGQGLRVLVTFHTLWNMAWCTPDYVKDPTCGKTQTLAILRDPGMQDAFVATVSHAIDALKGTPGIWAWALLNEPWYWPKTLEPPHDKIDQRQMAVRLVERLARIVKDKDGRPVTVRFVSMHTWKRPDGTTGWTNIFVRDWQWDERLFGVLDFVGLNAYRPEDPALHADWRRVTTENVRGVKRRFGKPVLITEFGADSDDDDRQSRRMSASIELFRTLPVCGWLAWMWNSEKETGGGCGKPGVGYNLCRDINGAPRAAYELLKASTTRTSSVNRW